MSVCVHVCVGWGEDEWQKYLLGDLIFGNLWYGCIILIIHHAECEIFVIIEERIETASMVSGTYLCVGKCVETSTWNIV